MRGGVAIGALALGSRERGGFSDSQVELLKTFAEQAVIAIGSAETYRELQQRTGELARRESELRESNDRNETGDSGDRRRNLRLGHRTQPRSGFRRG